MHGQGGRHTLPVIIDFQFPDLPKGQQVVYRRHVVLRRRWVHGSARLREGSG